MYAAATTGVVVFSARAVSAYATPENAATAVTSAQPAAGFPASDPTIPRTACASNPSFTRPPRLPDAKTAKGTPSAMAADAASSCAAAATAAGEARAPCSAGACATRKHANAAARASRNAFPALSHMCAGSSMTAAPSTPAPIAANFPALGFSTPWNTAIAHAYTGTS